MRRRQGGGATARGAIWCVEVVGVIVGEGGRGFRAVAAAGWVLKEPAPPAQPTCLRRRRDCGGAIIAAPPLPLYRSAAWRRCSSAAAAARRRR